MNPDKLLTCTRIAGLPYFFTIVITMLISFTLSQAATAQNMPGGFIELPGSAIRTTLSSTQISQLLPQRGRFNFPAPYNTAAIRLTNSTDCNGNDCVNYLGYSYWRNINNHIGQDSMLVLVGLDRNEGGPGPSLFQYNKLTDRVDNLGPLFESSHPLSWASGEGWYFSASNPTALYVNDQQKLQRYDVIRDTFTTVFSASLFGSGRYLWQFHSSADDNVHSATLRSTSDYAMLGCVVYFENTGQSRYYPRRGQYDECQVDKSGKWLLIKENVDSKDGEDNRIVNLVTGQERVLLDRDGAGGHSDLGFGYMVAADNWASAANTIKLWNFNSATLQGKSVYQNNAWQVSAPDHITHSNTRPDLAPEQQYACGSSLNQINAAHANEIICFGLDGDNQTLVVAPVMTNAYAGDAYTIAPKGNLDPTGRYFIWTSNAGSSRMDVFMVKVPGHLLDGSAGTSQPAPGPATGVTTTNTSTVTSSTVPTLMPSALAWTAGANLITGPDGALTKSGGCDGCPDASAVSQQSLASGSMSLEFTPADIQKLFYMGISQSQNGTLYNQIDHALRIQSGRVEVRENGAYRSETGIRAGDKLMISIVGGTVRYSRNGAVFHTSTLAPRYPLRAYATLVGTNSKTGPVRVMTP